MIGIQLDEQTTDLKLTNGRLSVGRVDEQNQFLLIKLEKGAVKRLPSRCVGAQTYLESSNGADLLREIRKEFVADGMEVDSVAFKADEVIFNAFYP